MITGWKEITRYVGRSRRVILQLCREHNFPLIKIEGTWTTSHQLIDEWLKRQLHNEKRDQ